MIAKIGQLHRLTEAQQASRAHASLAAITALERICGEIASKLHGWGVRLVHRAG
jgi:hypothetical protein